MGGQISTRSLCEFPYTFDDNALEIYEQNQTSALLSLDDCTRTYGNYLGVKWLVFQIIVGVFSGCYALPVLLVRMYKLRAYASLLKRRYMSLTQAKVFICGIILSSTIFLEMIDPFGFHGILPTQLYFVLDELIAATCYVLAVVIVDFWCLCAKGMKRNDSGLPKSVMIGYCIMVYCNYVGFEITGMIDYKNYFFWEAIKMFGGVALLAVLSVVGWVYVRQIESSLVSLGKSMSDQKGNTDQPEKSSRGLVTKLKSFKGSAPKSNSEKIVSELKRKYRQFFAVCIFAGLVLCGNGVSSITRPAETMSWGYSILETETYVIAVFLKMAYLGVISIVLHFFHVPKSRPDAMQSSQGKTGSSSKDLFASSKEGQTEKTYNAPNSSSFMSKVKSNFGKGSSNKESLTAYAPPRKTQVASIYDVDREEDFESENPALADCLNDKIQCKEFLEFCKEKHGQENVLCYLAIQRFERKVSEFGIDSQEAQSAGQDVLTTFVLQSASFPINASAHNIEELRSYSMPDGTFAKFGERVFHRIKREVFDIMGENFFEPFLQHS